MRKNELRAEAVSRAVLVAILAAGAALRLYGLNWDGGQWLHPDERQIYFVALGLGWPAGLAEALDAGSPLNPGFFAYGSLPIYLVRAAAGLLAPLWPAVRDPDNLHLVGRLLAAVFDLGTVVLTYRLAGVLAAGRGPRLLAAALVGLAVAHIQAAHFYTADVLLAFWSLLALSLAFDRARGAGRGPALGLALAVGLALATKVAALPLLLLVPVACWQRRSTPGRHVHAGRARGAIAGGDRRAADTGDATAAGGRMVGAWLVEVGAILAVALAAAVLAQPYALLDWPTFLADTWREAQIAGGRLAVPYTLQYAGTAPYLYPAWQVALWGVGPPAGLLAWAGLAGLLLGWLRRGGAAATLLLAWAGPFFLVTGLLYAKPLRYVLPLVPVLCVLAAGLVGRMAGRLRPGAGRRVWRIGTAALALAAALYALLFATTYAQPHSWIAASAWVYRHVPAGSRLAVEEWDTALPLPLELDGRSRRIEEYQVSSLAVYQEPDDAAKWQALAAELAGSDYLIVASRRAYGALGRLPGRYPLAAGYYQQLFAGELGFELASTFERGPAWLNPRVPPLPGAAPAWLLPDESFVVYDHPRVLIFRNAARLPAAEILERIGS